MVRREKKPASKAAPRGGARSVVSNYGVLAASVKTLSCGTKPESTVTPDGKRAKSSASHQPEANPYGYRLLVMEMGQLSWVDIANNQDLAVCQTEDVKRTQASQMLLNNAGENWFQAQPDKQDWARREGCHREPRWDLHPKEVQGWTTEAEGRDDGWLLLTQERAEIFHTARYAEKEVRKMSV